MRQVDAVQKILRAQKHILRAMLCVDEDELITEFSSGIT